MGATYTKRFFAGHVSTTPGATVTVPGGVVWIVRNVVLVPEGTAGVNATIQAPGDIFVYGLAVSASHPLEMFTFETRIVLVAGEKMLISVGGGTISITVTGYEFTA